MASMIVGTTNYNLEFGWHSVLQGNQQSIPMWSDTSADGKLLTLARFQSKEEADEYTFWDQLSMAQQVIMFQMDQITLC